MVLPIVYGIGCAMSFIGTVTHDMYRYGNGTLNRSNCFWNLEDTGLAFISTIIIGVWPLCAAAAIIAGPGYLLGSRAKTKRLRAIENKKLLETSIDNL